MAERDRESGTQAKKTSRLSCGVVIVRHTPEGPCLLLLRAYANWDFPKGMQEQGEEPLQTAVREVREETLIDDLDFPWDQIYFDTGPYSSRKKTARYFIGVTVTEKISLPVNPQLGAAEHHEWRWVSLSEARDLVAPRVQLVLDWVESILDT